MTDISINKSNQLVCLTKTSLGTVLLLLVFLESSEEF